MSTCVKHVLSAWTTEVRDGIPRLMRWCYVCKIVEWEDDERIAGRVGSRTDSIVSELQSVKSLDEKV